MVVVIIYTICVLSFGIIFTRSFITNFANLLLLDGLLADTSKLATARSVFVYLQNFYQDEIISAGVCRIDIATSKFDLARKTCEKLEMRALVGIGDIYSHQGNQAIALSVYELASELHPQAALVFFRLGLAYSPGEVATVKAYKEAIRLAVNGDNSLSKTELASVHVQLAQNYFWWEAYRKTIHETEQAIKLFPAYSYAYRLQSLAYANLGQYKEAVDSIQKAVHEDSSFWPYLEWGDIYQLEGEVDKASEKYLESIKLADNSNYFWGYERLCKLYLAIREVENSIMYCEKLVKQSPREPGFLLLLGDAYSMAKDVAAADNVYREALKFDPENQVILKKLQKK